MNKIEADNLILVVCHVAVDFYNTFIGKPIKVLENLWKLSFYLKICALVTESVHQNNAKMLTRAIKGMK